LREDTLGPALAAYFGTDKWDEHLSRGITRC
jgi:hypothetical protein